VDAESRACEFVRSKLLWNHTDSCFSGCGFAADKFGDEGGGGRRRLTRPLALDGDLTFQTAAVRRHGFSISRRDLPEVCQLFALPSKTEGAGNTGCTLHPRSREQRAQKTRSRAYRFSGGTPAFPAQWFYAYTVLSPAIRPWVVTVAGGVLPADLTPVRQRRPPRPPLPRPASVTLRDAPLSGTGFRKYRSDLGQAQANNSEKRKHFCRRAALGHIRLSRFDNSPMAP
jgi:hypothetical protein